MRFYWLTLGVLCVRRVTHLLQAEDGPWDIFARFRRRVGAGFWGSMIGCFYCLSLWVAAPFAYLVGDGRGERLILWPALSAGAILLERLTGAGRGAPPAVYFEDQEEEDDGLLRKTEGEFPGRDAD